MIRAIAEFVVLAAFYAVLIGWWVVLEAIR